MVLKLGWSTLNDVSHTKHAKIRLVQGAGTIDRQTKDSICTHPIAGNNLMLRGTNCFFILLILRAVVA